MRLTTLQLFRPVQLRAPGRGAAFPALSRQKVRAFLAVSQDRFGQVAYGLSATDLTAPVLTPTKCTFCKAAKRTLVSKNSAYIGYSDYTCTVIDVTTVTRVL
jgi:hypothetical protein